MEYALANLLRILMHNPGFNKKDVQYRFVHYVRVLILHFLAGVEFLLYKIFGSKSSDDQN